MWLRGSAHSEGHRSLRFKQSDASEDVSSIPDSLESYDAWNDDVRYLADLTRCLFPPSSSMPWRWESISKEDCRLRLSSRYIATRTLLAFGVKGMKAMDNRKIILSSFEAPKNSLLIGRQASVILQGPRVSCLSTCFARSLSIFLFFNSRVLFLCIDPNGAFLYSAGFVRNSSVPLLLLLLRVNV